MASQVYRRIPAADPDLVAEAGTFAVADLHEAMGPVQGRMALLDPSIQALNRGLRISGQAVTAYVFPGDALLAHKALTVAGPGHVLVVANSGAGPATMFAELVSLAARRAGIAGAVVDGGIRDTDALEVSRFPVWSTGRYCGHTTKRGPGAVNIPVVCGGVLIEPGDVIVADGDGVISIPLAALPGAVAQARLRAERERAIRTAIAGGQSLFDLIGGPAACAAAGVQEHDHAWNEDRKS